MGQSLSLPFRLWKTTTTYWSGLYYYALGSGRNSSYELVYQQPSSSSSSTSRSIPGPLRLTNADTPDQRLFKQHARIHLYSLAANFYLYDKPHYRKPSYRDDLVDNLRNVAIPGTGIPLSWIARNKYVAGTFLAFGYPLVSLVASLHKCVLSRFNASVADEYRTRLLAPDDWFSYWRLNCILVGLHSLLNDGSNDIDNDVSAEYEMENKWTFLQEGEARGVPVSPFLAQPESLVIKHRNEEGGMGIYFYRNAVFGGDWILQERLHNSDWVNQMLPDNAPLSTFRVITCSHASYRAADGTNSSSAEDVEALSVVFRAGRKGALTDHDSILFDVNKTTGEIGRGTTNANWYQLGPAKAARCPWRSPPHDVIVHPDAPHVVVTGNTVPNVTDMLRLVESAHRALCPRVPMAGWDVVLCKHETRPICLLEVNLSCNFFRGSFDVPKYLDFCDRLLSNLQRKRMERQASSVGKDKAQ